MLEARGGSPQMDKRRDRIWEPSELQLNFLPKWAGLMPQGLFPQPALGSSSQVSHFIS